MNYRQSDAEEVFIRDGIKLGVRQDGREALDLRTLMVENNVLPQVNGSSRLRLGLGTEILCSVKLEISEPSEEAPGRGKLEVSVDINQACVRQQGYQRDEGKRLGNVGTEMSEFLRNMYVESGAVDLDALCVIPGKFCWTVFIDVVVLQTDCNVLDASTLAIFVALDCTRIPKLQLVPGESGGMEDFEVVGDLSQATALPVHDVPLLVTVHWIGSTALLDASAEEIACANGTISVAVDAAGCCRSLHKQKIGAVDVPAIKEAVAMASHAVASLLPVLTGLKQDAARVANDGVYEDVVPIRQGFLF